MGIFKELYEEKWNVNITNAKGNTQVSSFQVEEQDTLDRITNLGKASLVQEALDILMDISKMEKNVAKGTYRTNAAKFLKVGIMKYWDMLKYNKAVVEALPKTFKLSPGKYGVKYPSINFIKPEFWDYLYNGTPKIDGPAVGKGEIFFSIATEAVMSAGAGDLEYNGSPLEVKGASKRKNNSLAGAKLMGMATEDKKTKTTDEIAKGLIQLEAALGEKLKSKYSTFVPKKLIISGNPTKVNHIRSLGASAKYLAEQEATLSKNNSEKKIKELYFDYFSMFIAGLDNSDSKGVKPKEVRSMLEKDALDFYPKLKDTTKEREIKLLIAAINVTSYIKKYDGLDTIIFTSPKKYNIIKFSRDWTSLGSNYNKLSSNEITVVDTYSTGNPTMVVALKH
jgi:hypothetical protein